MTWTKQEPQAAQLQSSRDVRAQLPSPTPGIPIGQPLLHRFIKLKWSMSSIWAKVFVNNIQVESKPIKLLQFLLDPLLIVLKRLIHGVLKPFTQGTTGPAFGHVVLSKVSWTQLPGISMIFKCSTHLLKQGLRTIETRASNNWKASLEQLEKRTFRHTHWSK